MLNIILFGQPGSGKGTQATSLVDRYGLVHISTGDLFRAEMKADTPLGLKAKEYIAKGELVPDEVTIGMLRNKVVANPDAKGFIFDGFPRTIPQAEALDRLLGELGSSISALIALDVPGDEIVKRILLRGETSGRADDKDESIIRNRMAVYQRETSQVADHYAASGRSFSVDGVGEITDVFQRLCTVIDKARTA
jgi:adenylate kinase